jgi:hypothetical protein
MNIELNRNVFTYWEGYRPAYIDFCLSTFSRITYFKVHIINPENIDKYLTVNDLNPRYKQITKIAQKVDCIRVALLRKYGGMWIDADTLIYKQPIELFNVLNDYDFACTKWDDGRVLNGYFLSKAEGRVITTWHMEIQKILRMPLQSCFPWTTFGEKIISPVLKRIEGYTVFDRNTVLPINIDQEVEVFFTKRNWEFKDINLIGLNHSWISQYKAEFIMMSLDRVITSDTLLGDIIGMFKNEKNLLERFTNIYKDNLWSDSESKSGVGSNSIYSENAKTCIGQIINEYGIKTITDAGCGDLFWMRGILKNNPSVSYLGVDIVPELIDNNKSLGLSNTEFVCSNLLDAMYIKSDLIICRDVFGHLTNEVVISILDKFKKSGSKYLLSTSFEGAIVNNELTGDWRAVNLSIEPFNLGTPLQIYQETFTGDDIYKCKKLFLWKLN